MEGMNSEKFAEINNYKLITESSKKQERTRLIGKRMNDFSYCWQTKKTMGKRAVNSPKKKKPITEIYRIRSVN